MKKWVLSIGFSIIFLTFAVIIVFLILDIANESYDWFDKVLIVPGYLALIFPIVLEELVLLRNLYKIICFNPRLFAKTCYIISSIIIICTMIFYLLVLFGVITQDIFPQDYIPASSKFIILRLSINWIAIVISFVIGSVRTQ